MPLRRNCALWALFWVGALSAALQSGAKAQTIAAPSNLTATAVSATQINLSWRDNSSNEQEFAIYRRLRFGTSQFALMWVVPANSTSFKDTTAQPATDYSYEIAARLLSGKKYYYSTPSNIADAKTFSPVPVVKLPIEVMGKAGTIVSTQVYVPSSAPGPFNLLWLKIHGESYANKVSVQVNNGAWINLNNSTAQVEEPGKTYGGIGGAFATLKMTVPLQTPVVAGTNTVSFRFNGTDGVSMGFRVLGFDFLNSVIGANALGAGTFVNEDPNTWSAPYTSVAAIAAGEKLWRTGKLTNSPINQTSIKAACGDCHAQDGRDLKYFNYSNFSIIERSKFHGLTEDDGKLIASFIRTRRTSNPGRPWNPPYQPGPGIDEKPVYEWSAGAGLDWALNRDMDTLEYVFPNGINQAAVATSGHLNVREIPVSLQLPDWNRWLPRIHPKDAWGTAFMNSEMLKRYDGEGGSSYKGYTLRQRFADASALPKYLASPYSKADINTWQARRYDFLLSRTTGPNIVWTPAYSEAVYSTALWQAVKMWEMVHEFNLAGLGKNYFGATAENRTWFDHIPFMASPFMLNIKNDRNGVGGSAVTNEYFSNAWYYTQLIVNPGNGMPVGTTPIDWGYVWGKFHDIYKLNGSAEMMRWVVYFVKGMQEHDNSRGLDRLTGWNPIAISVSIFVRPAMDTMWANVPGDQKTQILEALLGAWLDKCKQFPPSEYYAEGFASPTYIPVTKNGYDKTLGDRLWYMIPVFRHEGVDANLIDETRRWAASLFPLAQW